MSKRKDILTAVLAFYNASTPSGVPAAERSEGAPTVAGEGSTSINVGPFTEQIVRAKPHAPLYDRHLRIRVDCRASSTSGSSAEVNVDPLLEWVESIAGHQISAAIVVDTAEIRWDMARHDAEFVLVPVLLAVRYTTQVGNTTVSA